MLKILEELLKSIDQSTTNFLGLYHSYNKITFAISLVALIIIESIGGVDRYFRAWGLLVLADWVTGIMASKKQQTMSSEKGYNGLMKKLGMLILLMVCNIIDKELEINYARQVCLLSYIGLEGFSILENLNLLGVRVPKRLWAIFNNMVDKSDGKKSGKK